MTSDLTDFTITNPLTISQDSLKDFTLSIGMFLLIAVALTGLCWTFLWCHLYVIFDRSKNRKPSTALLCA
ncbi:unnamed protein product [Nippostrongylus brasiliensis]|uniref:E3 CR1-alpha n=1 Tax=Nippostrongylus brasiliensis TaxID=27835 RepID=A0A0N4XZW6_NIPBR|nr:hypothetical protein Q1695_010217 [Nippostrongylus brasiliensis]VDL72358.1 unnamed protein product [Nippostrongylus brasiliensis]